MAKEVLIVGAGFGGLEAARELAGSTSVNVTVVDQRNHHLFQPLLYQVATAGLNPSDIASPVRAQFSGARNVDVHLGRVTRVDLDDKRVFLGDGPSFSWNFLILACGATHSYFGRPEWEQFAPGLKTLEQALEIRRRILFAFEAADDLRALGVEVRTSSAVTAIDGSGVEIGGKERITARSVFWAAGVQASELARSLGVGLDRAGRVKVNADLSVPGHRDAFVIGDMAHFDEPGRGLVPGLAPAAIQQGRLAARNILASVEGRPRKPFRYRDKGMMATIGK